MRAFGIRAKLSVAFLGVATITVVAGLIAWRSFGDTSAALEEITERRVATVLALSRLVLEGNGLLGAAPSVLFVTTEDEFNTKWQEVARAEDAFQTALRAAQDLQAQDLSARDGPAREGPVHDWSASAQMRESPGQEVAPEVRSADRRAGAGAGVPGLTAPPPGAAPQGPAPPLTDVLESAGRISAHLQILASALQRRWRLEEALASQGGRLATLYERFRPAEAGSLLVLLGEARVAREEAELAVLRDRVLASLRALARSAGTSGAAAGERFYDEVGKLLSAPDNLFALRAETFIARGLADRQVAAVRQHTLELSGAVGRELARARDRISATRAAAETTMEYSRRLLIASSGIGIALALLLAWYFIGASVIRRLAALRHSMLAIAAGDLRAAVPSGGADEVAEMAEALTVFRDAMAKVDQLSRHDPLTGLASRRQLDEWLGHRLARGRMGALIVFDLLGYRGIADTFGQALGDRVLENLAERIAAFCGDEGVRGLAVRLDRDTFAIAFEDNPSEIVGVIAERLAGVVRLPLVLEGLRFDLGACYGVVRFPSDGDAPSLLLARADLARAASHGDQGHSPVFYDPALEAAVTVRRARQRDLGLAVERGQMELVYQPKIALAGDRLVGMEALIRWRHPEEGVVSPASFIPIAERSGLIVPIGNWILQESCRQTRAWQHYGTEPLRVAVNVSPVQMLQHDLRATVERALNATGLDPTCLELEITEGLLMREDGPVLGTLADLRAMGVRIAIDDFGTGYSSLNYLKRLPVTCLKIDQSFVRDMLSNLEDERITRTIIGIAHDLGMEVVAEGVETADQAAFLRSEGCEIGQGYYFGRPLAVPQFSALIVRDGAGDGSGGADGGAGAAGRGSETTVRRDGLGKTGQSGRVRNS